MYSYKLKTFDQDREDRLARRSLQKEFQMLEEREKEQEKESLSFSLFVHSFCKDKAEELPGHAQTVMEDFDDDVGVTIKKEIVPLASQIFAVCCWLTNLDVPMVESTP
ncbi:uncharacterized protein LOC111101586 isoform X1 [Crassostrea virginica]